MRADRGSLTIREWITVRLGTHPSVEALLSALDEVRPITKCEITPMMLGRVEVAPCERTVKLFLTDDTLPSGQEHVWPNIPPKQGTVLDEARALHLELCPAEVAPQLLLQHRELLESVGGSLEIAMEPFPLNGAEWAFILNTSWGGRIAAISRNLSDPGSRRRLVFVG